ncbi:MAG: tail fiber protein [Caldilineaceae bacterium]
MSDTMIGEIILFAGNFAPRGWAFCNGQLLQISANTALFSILGVTYGGDGQYNFALPDLRGRVPVGTGQGPGLDNVDLGQQDGESTHTLSTAEMPAHNHQARAHGSTAAGDSATPTANTWAVSTARDNVYGSAAPNSFMAPNTVTVDPAGSDQAHNNMQPYTGLNYIIALDGVYPTRN